MSLKSFSNERVIHYHQSLSSFRVVVDGENLPAAGALDDPSGLAKAPLESTVGYVRSSHVRWNCHWNWNWSSRASLGHLIKNHFTGHVCSGLC